MSGSMPPLPHTRSWRAREQLHFVCLFRCNSPVCIVILEEHTHYNFADYARCEFKIHGKIQGGSNMTGTICV